MSIKLTLSKKEIKEILLDYIETSTSAVMALQTQGSYDPAYDDKNYCISVVAQVLYLNKKSGYKLIEIPEDFPCSRCCIAYGFMVAAYIILNR